MEDTIKYRGYTIRIVQDEDPRDPREDSQLGIMAFFHNRYSLGDKEHGIKTSMFNGWDEMRDYIERTLKGVLIMPVFMYDHSGVTISVNGDTYPYNDRWDAGQIGFIFTTSARIREWYNKKAISSKTAEKAKKHLLFEIDEYDQYLRGDVYGYVVEDKTGEQVESCYGFFGDEWVVKEAKSTVDCLKDGPRNGNRTYDKQQKAKTQLRDASGRFVKQS